MLIRKIQKFLTLVFTVGLAVLPTQQVSAQAAPKAPPKAAPAATPQQGGTLVMVVQPEPPTLASFLSTAGPVGQVATKVYEGLLEYDFKLAPQPGLAKSWTVSPDGKTITFKLQENVTFHDGKPFTSADVKFTVFDVLKNHIPEVSIPFVP